jgi:diacylglycerol O-acyltransferase
MARYHSRPLDMNRPPWEMFVVEGLDNVEGLPPGATRIVTKIHHAAVDGASLMKFFCHAGRCGQPRHAARAAGAVGRGAADLPPVPQLLRRALRNNLGSPLRDRRDAHARVAGPVSGGAGPPSPGARAEAPVPATRFNVDVSPHKMFDARVFPSKT